MGELTPRDSEVRQSQQGAKTTSGADAKPASGLLAGKPFAEQEALLCVSPRGKDETVPPWKRNQTQAKPTPHSDVFDDMSPGSPATLESCEAPASTRSAVRDLISVDLGDAVTTYIRELCHAEASAMNRFIHATGGAPGTSLNRAGFFGLVADVVAGGLVEDGLKNAAKRRGLLHGKLADMLFGTVTGVAWGLLTSLIFDDDNDELVHLALVAAGQRAQDAFDKIHTSGSVMTAQWMADRKHILGELDTLPNLERMRSIASWAKEQIARLRVTDTQGNLLFGQLMERWLLERAKDDEDAGRGVNKVSHKAALPVVLEATRQGDRSPVTDGQRITKPDLFLNQMTYQLSKVGLGSHAATAFFGRRFQELKTGNTPEGLAALMKRETFLVRETIDEKQWHGATTWTHYRAPDRALEPPGASSAMEARRELGDGSPARARAAPRHLRPKVDGDDVRWQGA